MDDLEERVSDLEERCDMLNANIISLQAIVNALQGNDYIVSITPVKKNDEEIGYTIVFAKAAPITIYHGEDGEDGKPGDSTSGGSGTDGKDGESFFREVRLDDGYVYFVLADGTELSVPKSAPLSITFDTGDLVAMEPNSVRDINYTVTSPCGTVKGGNISLYYLSNTECDVIIPDGVDWILIPVRNAARM